MTRAARDVHAAALIDALPPDDALRCVRLGQVRLNRIAVVSAIRRLVYARHYAPDRARWSGLWVDRLTRLETAGIAYPCGPLSADCAALTPHEYDRIARVLRDAETRLIDRGQTP